VPVESRLTKSLKVTGTDTASYGLSVSDPYLDPRTVSEINGDFGKKIAIFPPPCN